MPEDASEKTDIPESPVILTRRRMFGMLAMTGASLLATNSQAPAFFNFFEALAPVPSGTLSDLDIPPEWKMQFGSLLPSYAQYLKVLKLRNVGVRDILGAHARTRGHVKNTLPPRALWKNIRETLKVVDSLSRRLELKPEELISIYRSPAYNAKCRGAKSNSYHVKNNAIDITFPCSPGKVTAMAKEMRTVGIFRGGVGRYGGFTHIDTRGSNVDWRA
ncbi:MAG: D-Ala-D-Ala carboxypeptidase family metallohydrolase [Terrimicrobiaceae bacterium]